MTICLIDVIDMMNLSSVEEIYKSLPSCPYCGLNLDKSYTRNYTYINFVCIQQDHTTQIKFYRFKYKTYKYSLFDFEIVDSVVSVRFSKYVNSEKFRIGIFDMKKYKKYLFTNPLWEKTMTQSCFAKKYLTLTAINNLEIGKMMKKLHNKMIFV